jgi:hypothetical protein
MVISNNYYGINITGSKCEGFVRNSGFGGFWSSRVRTEILVSNNWCGNFQTKWSANIFG